MPDWTTIAVRDDTHKRLERMKMVKTAGRIENFDDVIRRGMGWLEDTKTSDKLEERL